ncbi:NTPase KAP family P-loop domain-containing protein 1 isoform X2 [Centroberyx affinis]|uniref:NTPase KAP family P-loop domain-containing protein 1 isoform X2 n=1 Tax=Centroberyx affinis TaxID=166261 RepID=UPI003A5BFC06
MVTKDDICAYALSKTLTKVSSPATVGLYSSCQNRMHMILQKIEEHMEVEAGKMEQDYRGRPRPRSVKPSLTGFLALLGRLLFYRPVWTVKNQQHHNIRFIYVHFSAWHFAGSDLLWAGLAIRLFQAMQVNFGKFPLVLYRVAQHDEEDEIIKKIIEDRSNDWRSKKICCCPLWLLFLSILLAAVTILVFLVTFGFPKTEVKPSQGGNGTSAAQVGVIEGLAIAALGVPAAGAVRFIFLMGKNLIFNQDLNIKRGMDNERVSNQLGFMNEVRKEMWLLSSFIHFMEVFERRRIRVVLKITNLDRCSPKKIVAVLDAINILLSDMESPFISILAVNPEVLVQKVNFADGCFSKEDRAYAFLNRIVTLAFTIPPLCDEWKSNLFLSLSGRSKITEDRNMKRGKQRAENCNKTSLALHESSMENAWETEESNIPLMAKTTAVLELREEEIENLINSAFKSICQEGKLKNYILDDAMSMRRVINSIRVTVIIMMAWKTELPPAEVIASWVVLANQWPCRLSWIFQCLEDDQQRAKIADMNAPVIDNSKTLWDFFSESRGELYVMRMKIEDLLEQDGDPEMFEMFLKVDFPFTIKDMEKFKLATVNLDHTIRKELGQIRGITRLKHSGWVRDLDPLPVRTTINMSAEDVCKEYPMFPIFPSWRGWSTLLSMLIL